MSDKLFRDAVHDYISIPSDFCTHFIDTFEFQRLRDVEQTSMRVLFPSARHDRFIHSLGTFYLGKKAFSTLTSSRDAIPPEITYDMLEHLERTFQIACLLHDCAHSPFSHTLEKFFESTANPISKTLRELAKNCDTSFHDDLEKSLTKPKEHEKASACLVLSRYHKSIETCGGDPVLAARMILGIHHSTTDGNPSKKFENLLINLLNGPDIDVDKLDYVLRDTWASGISNVKPDMHRLISSLRIRSKEDGSLRLAFHKSGLSAIQQVLDARNHLYKWIFSHHKVVYGAELIKLSVESLEKMPHEKTRPSHLFDMRRLLANEEVHLPSDSDILSILRTKINDIPECKEWFSRQHTRKPYWKSYAEFMAWKREQEIDDPEKFRIISENLLKVYYSEEMPETTVLPLIAQASVKTQSLLADRIWIQMGNGDKYLRYEEIFRDSQENNRLADFFYIFFPNECHENIREKILSRIKNEL